MGLCPPRAAVTAAQMMDGGKTVLYGALGGGGGYTCHVHHVICHFTITFDQRLRFGTKIKFCQ